MKNFGQKELKGMGERYQGRRAASYNPSAGRWTKALRRVQSGNFLPTERSRRLTIASGNKWKSERNEEAQALVSRTYEKALSDGYSRLRTDDDGNYLDATGHIVDRAHAQVQNLHGVAAGKQALVDMAGMEGNDANNRAAQAAHKMLLDTSSEIELQHARIGGTRPGSEHNMGKRVTEVDTYRDTLENSPQHYSHITRSRPDQAPDVIESAQSSVGDEYSDAYTDTNPTTRAARIRALDVARLTESIKRLTPEQVANAHYGFYEDIARMGDPTLSHDLANRLRDFKTHGGPNGASAVGSLLGGKEGHVNAALNLAGTDVRSL